MRALRASGRNGADEGEMRPRVGVNPGAKAQPQPAETPSESSDESFDEDLSL